jgi:hypothetical protein
MLHFLHSYRLPPFCWNITEQANQTAVSQKLPMQHLLPKCNCISVVVSSTNVSTAQNSPIAANATSYRSEVFSDKKQSNESVKKSSATSIPLFGIGSGISTPTSFLGNLSICASPMLLDYATALSANSKDGMTQSTNALYNSIKEMEVGCKKIKK